MTLIFVRAFFIISSTVVGYYIGALLGNYDISWKVGGMLCGLGSSIMIIFIELGMRRFSMRNVSAGVFGLIFGFFMAWILTSVLKLIPMSIEMFSSLQIILILIFCYLGMAIGIRGKDEFNLIIPYVKFVRQDKKEDIILLDTSVIIDGRIADIFQTHFIEGRLVVPRFVLKELQQIADSQDALKKEQGRRGLDILNKMQKTPLLDVKIEKTIFLNLKMWIPNWLSWLSYWGREIFTNDFNLNKIAELRG